MNASGEQAGTEQDFLDGPGFTAADIKPSGFFTGLSPMTPLRGIASGALEAGSVLVNGLPSIAHALSTSDIADVSGGSSIPEQAPEPGTKQPWEDPLHDWAQKQSDAARAGAKSVIPDPRTSGSAANLVFGASKTLTEGGIALVGTGGNLPAAAATMGYISGMARYRDLKDQGVDDETAEKLATTEGLLQGAGMVAPMGLPAKWIEAMTPVRQALTQMATGAAANAGQGVASRYITHQILSDAGYQALADQSKPLDGEAMAADLISGAFFGGAHYAGQRPELAERARQLAANGQIDQQIRDAAKVVQTERMAAVDRAPGVPVNPQSQAMHQAALEKSISDLLQDRPVDVGNEATGATFARPAEDEVQQQPLRDMVLDEFKKAGVADEQAKLGDLESIMEEKYSGSVKPREQPIDLPKSEEEPTPWDDLNDQLPTDEELQEKATAPEEPPRETAPGTEPSEVALARTKDIASTVSENAPKMFAAAADCASKTA